jgi:proton glutamate symport protein
MKVTGASSTALLLVAALSGVSARSAEPTTLYPPDVQRIRDRGKLIVAQADKMRPGFFANDDERTYMSETSVLCGDAAGKPHRMVGLDIELARKLADELGVDLAIDRSPPDFDAACRAVASGQADLAISKLSITTKRAQYVHFTRPYITLRKGVLINRLEETRVRRGPEVLHLCDHPSAKVGVVGPGSFVDFAKRLFPSAQLVVFSSSEELVQAVRKGDILAAFYEEFEFARMERLFPDTPIYARLAFLKGEEDQIAIAVSPSSPTLLRFLNLYMETRNVHITVPALMERFFPYEDKGTEAAATSPVSTSEHWTRGVILLLLLGLLAGWAFLARKPVAVEPQPDIALASTGPKTVMVMPSSFGNFPKDTTSGAPASPPGPPSRLKILRHPLVCLLGIMVGLSAGLYHEKDSLSFDLVGYMRPLGKVYLSLLQMCVIPTFTTAIVVSLGNMFRSRKVGRSLGRLIVVYALGITLASTAGVAAGLIGKPGEGLKYSSRQVLSQNLGMSDQAQAGTEGSPAGSGGLTRLFESLVPENVFFALSYGKSLALISVSILLGVALGLKRTPFTENLMAVMCGLYEAFFRILDWSLYALPFGLACLLADQVAVMGTEVITALARLVIIFYCSCAFLCVLYVLTLKWVTLLPLADVLESKKESLAVAFATSSSIAAIPIALQRMHETLKLPRDLIHFLVPLGVVINRHGYPLLFALTTVFIAQLYQQPIGLGSALAIVLAASLSGMAAVGSPAAVAPMVGHVLMPLGLPVSIGTSILVSISPVIDPMASMTNLFGGCASAAVISKTAGQPAPEQPALPPLTQPTPA